MSVISFDHAEQLVELVMSQYRIEVDKQEHHESIAEIYGEVLEGEPVEVQFADQGRIIAVLYWKLAQARGLIDAQ